MSIFSQDLATYIVDLGLATGLGDDIFINYSDSKQDIIVVRELHGFRTEQAANPAENTERPMARIEVCYTSSVAAIAKIEEIIEALQTPLEVDLGAYHYGYMRVLNSVQYLGRTDDNRVCYHVDINTIRRK